VVKCVVGVAAVILGCAAAAVAAPSRSHVVTRSCGRISDYDPAWSPSGQEIAFTRLRASGARSEIDVVDADGRRERRISATSDYAYGAAWSPDGSRIAYSTFDLAAVVRIVVANARGSGAHVVATFQDEREPPATYLAWARDGRRVAYVDAAGALMAADAQGRTPPHVLAPGATQPAWSPYGRRIAYVTPDGIAIADADGSSPRMLARGAYPAWSPDGRRVAYVGVAGTGVHVVGSDGSADRLVDSHGTSARWQADGRTLVDATPSDRAHGAVRLVDLRTHRVHTLTHDASRSFGSDDAAPTGSRTGVAIAFVSTPRLGGSEIRLVRADGRLERRLTYHCVVPDENTGGRIYGTWLADVVLARNHLRDTVFCGPGRDVALVDHGDRARGCERVRR
jgi:Tol biopolymer transport system component